MTAGTAPPLHRIGIAGLGLIGGSIAHDLRARWPDVHVAGVDAHDVLDAALASGVIHDGSPSVNALADADLVVLAAPVPAIIDLIGALGSAGFRGIVTDVGSTKRQILAAAERAGLTRFVGGHPMAGSERGGFVEARPGLFAGQPWFIVPPRPGTRSEERDAVERLARALGAVPVDVDAATHDRTVAHVSHLPQLLAVALMNTAVDACGETTLAHAGRGFADMTRLARSPADLWTGILDTNRDCIAQAVLDLINHLEPLVDSDTRQLEAAFAQAARTRQRTV